MCEVGVAAGLSSVMLLEGCLRGGGDPNLYAYDTMDKTYSIKDIRSIAFYLPQYNSILENDKWWGKAYLEAVKRVVQNNSAHQ